MVISHLDFKNTIDKITFESVSSKSVYKSGKYFLDLIHTFQITL